MQFLSTFAAPSVRPLRHGSWLRVLAALLLLVSGTWAFAQAPFPTDALVNATTQQAALAAIGAAQAEPSTHLLLDAPDIALPGPLKIAGKSLLPGTSHLVLLRVTRVPPRPPAPREKPLLLAKRVEPGKPASIDADADALSTLSLVLLAQARGKWFYVQREVKIGRPGASQPLP